MNTQLCLDLKLWRGVCISIVDKPSIVSTFSHGSLENFFLSVVNKICFCMAKSQSDYTSNICLTDISFLDILAQQSFSEIIETTGKNCVVPVVKTNVKLF